MDLTYAVADIHGALDMLELGTTAIWLDAAAHSAGHRHVVFLGDYVDRGPDSRGVVEALMAGPPLGWEWTFLTGNHELMMLDATSRRLGDVHFWLDNGGAATLDSYGVKTAADVPAGHLAWLRDLRPYHVCCDHRLYVHGGVRDDRGLGLQGAKTLAWVRRSPKDDRGWRDRHVVHGHTPTHEPLLLANRTNLDTYAWQTGELSVGVFDDAVPGGPIEVLRVARPSGESKRRGRVTDSSEES